jgi:hypothetical protein
MDWFLKEQREEVASMSALLAVVEPRARQPPLWPRSICRAIRSETLASTRPAPPGGRRSPLARRATSRRRPPVDDELVAAFARLVPQLSSSAQRTDARELEEIVCSPARRSPARRDDDGAIIGSLTLVVFRTPTGATRLDRGRRGGRAARGPGAGEALVGEAIRLASESGSAPST